MGHGERDTADGAAVEKMREALGEMDISGRIVIGEGERDEAPMLFIGEEVGRGGPEVDIAVDPVEGTNSLPTGCPTRSRSWRSPNAAACCTHRTPICRSWRSGPKAAPYVHIDAPVRENLEAVANAHGKTDKRRHRHHSGPPAACRPDSTKYARPARGYG